jgi:hypothetical protein
MKGNKMTELMTLDELDRLFGLKDGDLVEAVGFINEHTNGIYTIVDNFKSYGQGPRKAAVRVHKLSGMCDSQFVHSSVIRVWKMASQKPKYTLWGDMSPEEKGALLLAHLEGEKIQISDGPDIYWFDAAENFKWNSELYYRIKPEPEISGWSGWFLSKQCGEMPKRINGKKIAEIEKAPLGNCKQFAFRVKLFK